MKTILLLLLIIILYVPDVLAQQEESWRIDSITIQKNWRTRDKIILRELLFSPGDNVDLECINHSISQIWNIGNFAEVGYSIDTISKDSYLMNLTAKDAFTLVPYIVVNGNKDDKNLSMGFSDNNFLGRNIGLNISGNIGSYKSSYSGQISIPRQLLYKNMTLSFQISSGTVSSYRYKSDKIVSGVGYRTKQLSGSIGNPWHTDYEYTFSPNFSWNLFQHKTDTSLVDNNISLASAYKVNYLALSLSESVGLINRDRHQKDGYSVSGGYSYGIGLNKSTPAFHSFGLGLSYYKILNPIIELSAGFSTGYTTSILPSLIHYMNSGDVKGILNGQESGQGHYNAKLNGSFTYLYTSWFALEHSVYSHWGMAKDKYINLYENKPRISVGSGIKIWAPMIPWLAASIHFTYLKGNTNWIHLDI